MSRKSVKGVRTLLLRRASLPDERSVCFLGDRRGISVGVRNRERWGLPAAAFAAIIEILRSRLYIRIYGIYFRTHSLADSETSSDSAITYGIYDETNANELLMQAKRTELELSEEFVRQAIEKGDICSATLIDGDIVSYGWSSFSATHDTDGVYAVFPPGYRYGYKAYTLPEYRGRHLRDGTIPLRDKYCAERGCLHSLSYVAVDNYASMRGARRNEVTRVGFAAFYKKGSRFVSYHSSGVRRLGFRFESRDGTPAR